MRLAASIADQAIEAHRFELLGQTTQHLVPDPGHPVLVNMSYCLRELREAVQLGDALRTAVAAIGLVQGLYCLQGGSRPEIGLQGGAERVGVLDRTACSLGEDGVELNTYKTVQYSTVQYSTLQYSTVKNKNSTEQYTIQHVITPFTNRAGQGCRNATQTGTHKHTGTHYKHRHTL
jgi:hypothetical protein